MRSAICVLAAVFSISLFAGEGKPDDMLDESQVIEYLAINQVTLKAWMAKGYLKPFQAPNSTKFLFRRDNVDAVKVAFEEGKKREAAASTAQINDRNFGRDENRDVQRVKEQNDRGAGTTSAQRSGVTQTDYRQAELEARRKEAEAARSGRSGSVTDDRQAERDRAQRARDAEKNAKRL